MSNAFSFIKGVGFSVAMLASLMVGINIGERHMEEQFAEQNEKDSIQDAKVEI